MEDAGTEPGTSQEGHEGTLDRVNNSEYENMAEQNGGGVLVIANGDIQYEERSIVDPGGGKVLEMFCTTESNTDKGVIKETYSSRLCENTKVENGEVVLDKNYVESAVKSVTEKSESGEEKVDTSRLDYEENERTRGTSAGNKIKEFSAVKEEKQEVSTKEIDPNYKGPNKKYLQRSRNSFSKSSVKHQTLLDPDTKLNDTDPELLALRDSLLSSYTPGSYVSKAMAATKDKALENYSATSTRCDYSESNPGGEEGEEGGAGSRRALTAGEEGGGGEVSAAVQGQVEERSRSQARRSHGTGQAVMTAGADEAGAATETTNTKINSKMEEEVNLMEFSGRSSVNKSSEIRENGVSSVSESSSRASSAHVHGEDEVTHGVKSSRATSDSGISVSGNAGPSMSRDSRDSAERSSRRSTPLFSGPYAYAEDRRSADELIKRILADSDLEPSPMVSRKYKVDMGGDGASYTTEDSSEFEDQSPASGSFVDHTLPSKQYHHQEGRQSLLERRLQNLTRDRKSVENETSMSYSTENKVNGEDSRRSMSAVSHGMDEHEGEVFLNEETIYMKKKPNPQRSTEDEGEVFINEETIYMKKKPSEEQIHGDEFAHEVTAMKNKYKEGQMDPDMEFLPGMEDLPPPPPGAHGGGADRYPIGIDDPFGARGPSHLEPYGAEGHAAVARGRYGEYRAEDDSSYSSYSSRKQRHYMEEEESRSSYAMRSGDHQEEEMGLVPYKSRGRMLRQQYIDDDDDVFYERTPEPERKPALPDEAFRPQRSEDTHEIVKEKTMEIKRVVEQQGDVLRKLKEASDSFDELSMEIKKMKQDFIERQVTRQMTLDKVLNDEEDDKDPLAIEYEPDTKPKRYGGRLAITSGNDAYDYGALSSSSASYNRSSYRSSYARSLDYGTSGSSYLSSSRSKYAAGEDEEDYEEPQFGKGLSSLASRGYGDDSYSASTAYGYKRKNFSRSKTMYDDADDDSGFSGKFGAGVDDTEPSALGSSYTRKYGTYGGSAQEDTESIASGIAKKYGTYQASEDSDMTSYRRRYSLQGDETASTASGDPDKDADDETPSYRRSYRGTSATSGYSSASSSSTYRSPYLSAGATTTDTSSYSPISSSRSSRLQRAQTLSDFDFSSSRSSYANRSSFGSGIADKPFSSRFLDKVREKKTSGASEGEASSSAATTKRDKPFKSRFLRSTFDTGSSYSSSSSSSRFTSKRSSSLADVSSSGSTSATATAESKE